MSKPTLLLFSPKYHCSLENSSYKKSFILSKLEQTLDSLIPYTTLFYPLGFLELLSFPLFLFTHTRPYSPPCTEDSDLFSVYSNKINLNINGKTSDSF